MYYVWSCERSNGFTYFIYKILFHSRAVLGSLIERDISVNTVSLDRVFKWYNSCLQYMA